MTASGLPALCVCAIALMLGSCKDHSDYTGWRVAGGSKKAQHYSSLTQIDSGNVGQLQVAWEYHTKDADEKNHSQIQCSPIVVDGVLYGTTPRVRLFAVDAATGAQKWVFDPRGNANSSFAAFDMNNNRGVTYW
ncbi:MAG: hypothetical protein ACXVI9_11100, partial [Mucilaginibacter sp.]